jgi:putative transposase
MGMGMLKAVVLFLRALLVTKACMAFENLALRQQLAVQAQSVKRPKLRVRDRFFWVCLSQLWPNWRDALIIVQPETVIKWHRMGFRLYWRWKSKADKVGRPSIEHEIRTLIRRMSRENPIWGAPRILSELGLLGYDVAESTVAKYMVRQPKPPSQTWRTFLDNHASDIAACDFFTIPTATFRILYCFVILSHNRRKVLHFNVTFNPTASWAAQQIVEAFPYDSAPKYLLRDNDSIYGQAFQNRIASLGIEEVKTAYHSPWQNPFVERLIGSVRRECLNHVIVLNERHLHRILSEYFDYYNNSRAHLSLDGNAPLPREVEPPERGDVIALPQVGGLHHRYTRVAA